MNWSSPFYRDLNSLFREFDRMLTPVDRDTMPRVNIWTHDDGAVINVELPGVEAEDLDISVHENRLTLAGTKNPLPLDSEQEFTWHRNERLTGSFSRTLALPFRIDPDSVVAEYQKGILTVKLAQEEADKPRQIEVTAM